MKFKLLHEAPSPGEELASKYNVHTYEEYKVWAKANAKTTPISEFSGHYSCIQRVVSSIIFILHITGQKPSYVVINEAFALKWYRELNDSLPPEVEGVKIAFNKTSLFETACIL